MQYPFERMRPLACELQVTFAISVEVRAEVYKLPYSLHSFTDHDSQVLFIGKPGGDLDGVLYVSLERITRPLR